MKLYKVTIGMVLWLLSTHALSQSSNGVEMADVLRSDGKIYTVVFGLVVILTGLIFFVIRVERKLSKLENQEKIKNNQYPVNK